MTSSCCSPRIRSSTHLKSDSRSAKARLRRLQRMTLHGDRGVARRPAAAHRPDLSPDWSQSENIQFYAQEYSKALGRTITFQDIPVEPWPEGFFKRGMSVHPMDHLATMAFAPRGTLRPDLGRRAYPHGTNAAGPAGIRRKACGDIDRAGKSSDFVNAKKEREVGTPCPTLALDFQSTQTYTSYNWYV
ncbi:MAG: NmrA family protein [Nitrospira sp.]|nr:NmrA family protein [Nitrospira sp.]